MVEVLGFLLGIHLTITLLAACYRIIDLGYRIKEYLPQIIKGISINLLAIILIYLLAMDSFVQGFLWGQISFVILHVLSFWIARLQLHLIKFR